MSSLQPENLSLPFLYITKSFLFSSNLKNNIDIYREKDGEEKKMDTRRGGGIGVGSGDGEFTRAFGRLWLALMLKNSELLLAFPAF